MPDISSDSFFMTEYVDRHRGILLRDVYYKDGRVLAFDGQTWREAFRLSGEQVAHAKAGIQASGLLVMDDLTADDVADTAAYTYAWRMDGQAGHVTNWAYPASSHPAFDTVDALLNELEAEASEGRER
jgi:hypothetical protein